VTTDPGQDDRDARADTRTGSSSAVVRGRRTHRRGIPVRAAQGRRRLPGDAALNSAKSGFGVRHSECAAVKFELFIIDIRVYRRSCLASAAPKSCHSAPTCPRNPTGNSEPHARTNSKQAGFTTWSSYSDDDHRVLAAWSCGRQVQRYPRRIRGILALSPCKNMITERTIPGRSAWRRKLGLRSTDVSVYVYAITR